MAASPRPLIAAAVLTLLAHHAPARGQALYELELDRHSTALSVPFKIRRLSDGRPVADVGPGDIVVTENGRPVRDAVVHLADASDPAAVVLVLDGGAPPPAVARAAQPFFESGRRFGWVLYDNRVRKTQPPTTEPPRLLAELKSAHLRGGTANLDAVAEALEQLGNVPGRKALVLQASAADSHSRRTLETVIAAARQAGVAIYVIGIGRPAQPELLSTVLVLDPATGTYQALSRTTDVNQARAVVAAAHAFVGAMRPGSAVLLFPAGGRLLARDFLSRPEAESEIQRIEFAGEKSIFDAAHTAVAALEAARRPGKRAVVLLTDGFDLHSRHRAEDVLADARAARIPVHVVHLGQQPPAMLQRLAAETGGSFQHAPDAETLPGVCEELSLRLHEEGIDERLLRTLAESTGARYFAAAEVEQLPEAYRLALEEIQGTYQATLPARLPGSVLDIYVRRDGVPLSRIAVSSPQTPALFVPRLEPNRYLLLLAFLSTLLWLRSRRTSS